MPKRAEPLKPCGDWPGRREGMVWKRKQISQSEAKVYFYHCVQDHFFKKVSYTSNTYLLLKMKVKKEGEEEVEKNNF